MHRESDETLREFGKKKYAAKCRLSEHCAACGSTAFPPDFLLDVACEPAPPGEEFFQGKIAELAGRLRANAFASVPATAFLFFGNPGAELRGLAEQVNGDFRVARRLRVVLLSTARAERALLLPAAELVDPFSAEAEKFLSFGAVSFPRYVAFADYLSAWEELAGENGTLRFLQKGYDNLSDKTGIFNSPRQD